MKLFAIPVVVLASLSFAPRAEAFVADCEAACAVAATTQHYSAGDTDWLCLDECETIGHPNCGSDWDDYFGCAEDFADGVVDSCLEEYSTARHCSICDLGRGDTEGMSQVYYVDPRPGCTDTGTGMFGSPLCSFDEGVARAAAAQESGESAKVFVCDGEYIQPVSASNPVDLAHGHSSKVILESVTKHGATVSGAPDWSSAFTASMVSFDDPVSNLLDDSADLGSSPAWIRAGVALDPTTPVLPTPCPGCDAFEPGDGWHVVPIPGHSEAQGLLQSIDELDGRVTFSVYMRPAGWNHFRLDFVAAPLPGATSSDVPAFDFELPETPGACTVFDHRGDGAGVEPVGTTGWYRVHFTVPFTPAAPATAVRLWFIAPPTTYSDVFSISPNGSDGVDIAGAQLDVRPITQFATEPREYVSAASGPIEKVFARTRDVLVSTRSSWTHDWGLTSLMLNATAVLPKMLPIARRSELLFYGGERLRQELTVHDLRPGSFMLRDGLLDPSDPNTLYMDTTAEVASTNCAQSNDCLFYVMPPEPVDLSSPEAIHIGERERLLYLNQVDNWEFRGFVFKGATGAKDVAQSTTRMNTAAVALIDGSELLLVDNLVTDNNAYGLGVAGRSPQPSSLQLLHNEIVDNGIGGETVFRFDGFVVEGERIEGNNWRGAQGQFSAGICTGAKYSRNEVGLVKDVTVSGNLGQGLWLDAFNASIVVRDSTFADNTSAGVYIERNIVGPAEGQMLVGNLFVDNAEGIRGAVSPYVTLARNTLIGNDVALNLNGVQEEFGGETMGIESWTLFENDTTATCGGDLFVRYGSNVSIDELSNFRANPPTSSYSPNNSWVHVEGTAERGFLLPANEESPTSSRFAEGSAEDWMCISSVPNVPPETIAALCP